ncbi:MAG: aminotransferase class III-fold pyridoxal phosphate-dependent enzyme [Paracoccaceae bacterium]|nr:aminotransferase class III-fold pyridoxal phosphate-dependent enzyme [Paracoccaceae bacterium]
MPEASTIGLRGRKVLWQPFNSPTDQVDPDGLCVIDRGEGVWLTDVNGRRFLDGIGALEAMAVGHGRTRLVEVASRQMKKLAFLDVFRYASEPAVELAEKLIEIAPNGYSKVAFAPGGSDANEFALKAIFQYHYLNGQPDRRRVICRYGAYHGTTFATGNMDGHYFGTRNDIYLGDERFGAVAEAPATGDGWGHSARFSAGAAEFEATIENLGPENVAAIVIDAVGTASGVSCPPLDDLKKIRALCNRHGILLLIDEVITGFARTGRMFASQYYGVCGDLMTMSKALTSGYQPLAACLVSKGIADFFESKSKDNLLAHGHTYGGHPVSCAVALENIAILEEENLAARAAEMGVYLRAQMNERLARHPVYLETRGVGLICGVDLFPKASLMGSFASAAEACRWLRVKLRDLGLVTLTIHPGTVFLLAPPLVIKMDEIDFLVDVFDEGLEALEKVFASADLAGPSPVKKTL